MVFSVYLLHFTRYHTEAWIRLHTLRLLSYTLNSTHFFQHLYCFISTRFQLVNVVTKNTSICQNISVQCQHILKEGMIKKM